MRLRPELFSFQIQHCVVNEIKKIEIHRAHCSIILTICISNNTDIKKKKSKTNKKNGHDYNVQYNFDKNNILNPCTTHNTLDQMKNGAMFSMHPFHSITPGI